MHQVREQSTQPTYPWRVSSRVQFFLSGSGIWAGEDWPDDEHGVVHDACSETRWVRYGSWNKDDELSWDEDRCRP